MEGSLELATACFERAVSCHQAGQLEEAVAGYREAIAHYPDHPQAWNNLGTALKALDRLPEAIEAYNEAVRISPDYVSAVYNLGTAYHVSGNLRWAYVNYRRADELRPNDINTMFNLAAVSEHARLHDLAAELYRKVLAQQPDHIKAMSGLGRCLSEAGRFDVAVPVVERTIAMAPGEARHWCFAGETFMEMGDWNRAIAYFERSIELAPMAADARMNLALANFRAGRFEATRALCQDLIDFDPAYGPAYMMMSQALRGLGRIEEAEQAHEKGWRLPGTTPAWIYLALSPPAVPFDREDINRSRERFHKFLDDAEAFGSQLVDPSLVIQHTAFYFAYHGYNDRPIMERLAKTMLKLAPSLNYVAPHCAKLLEDQAAASQATA